MNTCEGRKGRLALLAGGDLGAGERGRLQAHLAGCRPCSEELAGLKSLVALARACNPSDVRLPEGVRYSIAQAASDRAIVRQSSVFRFVPSFLSWRPAVVGLAAALGIFLAIVPLVQRDARVPGGHADISKINVSMKDGAVKLVWTNGGREKYTVYRGADPRGHSQGEVYVVQGHSWIDREAQEGPIVYYRIE